MLVLTRRRGESIVIGDDVVVTVLEATGDSIRLGITAPREVPVHREEVLEDIRATNRRAAAAPPTPTPDLLRLARPRPRPGPPPARSTV